MVSSAEAGQGAAPAEVRERRQVAAELLVVLTNLVDELHPYQKGRRKDDLYGSLDRSFGLDSLGRVELIHRLEAGFNVRLAERLFAEASTPADLLEAILAAHPAPRADIVARSEDRTAPQALSAPEHLESLTAVLAWHSESQGGRAHIYLSDGDREQAPITYAELQVRARRVAAGLQAKGLEPGQRIGLMLPTGADFFAAFFGVMIAGGAPVPIYPPWRLQRLEEQALRQAGILRNAGALGLIAAAETRAMAAILLGHVPSLRYSTTVDGLEAAAADAEPAPQAAKGEDLAFLQYTSGSTADPKGVMLSHHNVLANIRALGQALDARPSDVFVSWLPLYHDMGLIGAWLACLYHAVPFVVMSPLQFLARPERWLWTIHRNRATLSAAPNFAYDLCLSLGSDDRIAGLDLSSIRVLGDGSEAVSPRCVRDFAQRFGPYGLRPGAILPVYGLAECAAGLTAPPLGRPPRIDRILRRSLVEDGRALPVGNGELDAEEFVSCGPPLIGHEVRIIDPAGRELPERREGRLQFRGPSATRGYFNNPEKTAELFSGDWLESGDLAYVAEGEVFVTGRTKDVVKRAGRNIHPADIETTVAALPGVEVGGAVLFGAPDPARGVERLVLVLETRLDDEDARRTLIERAQETAADHLEAAPDDVLLVPPGTIPRTESGKIRRLALRSAYLKGHVGGGFPSPKTQVRQLQLAALAGRLRALRREAVDWLYSRYWWSVIVAFGLVLWPLMLVLPGLGLRWAVLHRASRLVLRLLGHRLTVTAEAPPADRNVVFVANHSSYIDSVALSAVLPGKLAFAVYKELAGQWMEGPFLRRLGVLFVERFEPAEAVAHAEQAAALARAGRPLVVFPEATIMRMPGLLDFHLGAFMAAARAGVPVVPVTIRGTRSILRHDHRWFPRRGGVEVLIGRPIPPADDGFEAAVALRDAARKHILAQVREPDLAAEAPKF